MPRLISSDSTPALRADSVRHGDRPQVLRARDHHRRRGPNARIGAACAPIERPRNDTEETQFFIGGSGQLLLDDGPQPVKNGDLIVLTEGTMHDLHNTGDEDLRVIGFFAGPAVEQHWTDEVWPGDLTVTKSPNE